MKQTTYTQLQDKAVYQGQFKHGTRIYFFDSQMKQIGFSVLPGVGEDESYECRDESWEQHELDSLQLTPVIKIELKKSISSFVKGDIEDRIGGKSWIENIDKERK